MEKKRVTYLDNIKILLTVLVIAHHGCQPYAGGGGEWIVKDSSKAFAMGNFLTVNMTFFMSAFFFISGYFVPKSKENRSVGTYIGKKAKRLLLPVVALVLCIVPIYNYIVYRADTTNTLSFIQFYIRKYWGEGLISYDHGWFLVSLFLYSLLYLLVEKPCKKIKGNLTVWKIVGFTAIMAVLTFLIRLFYSIDTWVDIFGVIGIEPAHLPQYLLWFFAGTCACENDWLEQITDKMGKIFSGIAAFTIFIIYFRRILPSVVINTVYLIFPLYETLMSVSIIITLIYLFKKYISSQNAFFKSVSQNAFSMYIWHNLFVVSTQVVLCGIAISGYVKSAIVAAVSVSGAYLISVITRKIARKTEEYGNKYFHPKKLSAK